MVIITSKKENKDDLEEVIELQILIALNARCGFFWKVEYPITFNKYGKAKVHKNRFVIDGVSDILGLSESICLGIEVKRPKELAWWRKKEAQVMMTGPKNKKEKRFYRQELFIRSLKENGGWGGFADSVKRARQIVEQAKENREQKAT